MVMFLVHLELIREMFMLMFFVYLDSLISIISKGVLLANSLLNKSSIRRSDL